MRRTLIAIVAGIVGLGSIAATSQTAEAGYVRHDQPAQYERHDNDRDRHDDRRDDRNVRHGDHDRDFHRDQHVDHGFFWKFCFWT